MLSALFASVADALISYAIDKLDPAERIKSWLRLDPARLAFKKALARAYSAFARQYPEYTSSLFDQSFLSKDALPELSKLLTRDRHPDPALLAQAWGRSLGAGADFAQAATKPAAYFLERFEAELKAEPALQSIFDSRALENLPKLEAEIQKLSTDLQRGLDEALKTATDYQKVTLHIGGDVKNSNIVIGDNNNVINNYYYTGDFIALNEYYIPPDGVFQRVRVDEFFGRDWLTAKVDAFLNDPQRKSGAFLLIGDAGVGKTSFMAHLVKERRYLHLFAEQAPGQAMLQRAMQSLGSQLVTRYQIDPYKDRDTLNALSVFPDFLERILRLAASTLTEGEKIVIVCDALDEAGTFPDHFVFGLPKELPDGVYFILSQRPVNVKLPNFEPVIENLEAQGEGNLLDIGAYLSAVAKRPEMAGQIRSKEYSEEFFIQTLKEKSQGVWMYLHYIIKEIESGVRAPLKLANLPTGLVGYYAEYWDAWRTGKRGKGEEAWDELYAPLLTTLAAAQEAISVETLIQWADVTAKPREVTRLLTEHWRAFITEKEKNGQKIYTPYHLSFKDFITGRVDSSKLQPAQANLVKDLAAQSVDAHKRIVCAFEKECNGEWEKLVEQDYPRIYLTAHLNGAGEFEKLRILLTEGAEKIKWAEAREKKDETYAGYLNDLTHVWDYAERENNYALAIRCMLIENSVHSLAANIPPKLIAEIGKAGLWSYSRCLETIRQKPESEQQLETLIVLAPNIPPPLHLEALTVAREIKDKDCRARALATLVPHLTVDFMAQAMVDALIATRKIQDESYRVSALSDLLPYLTGEIKDQVVVEALSAVRKISKSYNGGNSRAVALSTLAPHLPNEFKTQALEFAREIERDYYRVSTLSDLVPYLSDELRAQVLVEALATVRKMKAEDNRGLTFSELVPHLPNEIKSQVLIEALSAAQEIKTKHDRVDALSGLAPHLPDELRVQVLGDALAVARDIEEKYKRSRSLFILAPHLPSHFKSQVLIEALAAAHQIENERDRVRILSDFAAHLPDELKVQTLIEILATSREIEDEVHIACALSDLASHLPEVLKSQALVDSFTVIRKIKTEHDRIDALTELASHLPSEFKAQTFTIGRKIDQIRALSDWAIYLPGDLKAEVFAATREIEVEEDLGKTLSDLAPYLHSVLQVQAFTIALVAEHEIKQDEVYGNRVLFALASHSSEDLNAQALVDGFVAAREIKNHFFRAFALSALAPHLPDDLKAQALITAREIQTDFIRDHALFGLVPHLPNDLRVQAFSILREIQSEYFRANTLSLLAPDVLDEFKEQALAIANEIQDDYCHALALSHLARHLPNNLKAQALVDGLAAANKIQNEHNRAEILFVLASQLEKEERKRILQKLLFITGDLEHLMEKWQEDNYDGLEENIIPFLKFISQKNRQEGLNIAGSLASTLMFFVGGNVVPELYRTIKDVTRWWQ